MSSVSGRYAIVGGRDVAVRQVAGVSTDGLHLEASKRAIEDAGIAPRRDRRRAGDDAGGRWASSTAGRRASPAYLGIEPTFSATMDLGRRHRLRLGADRDRGDRRRLLHRRRCAASRPRTGRRASPCSSSAPSSRCRTATSARSRSWATSSAASMHEHGYARRALRPHRRDLAEHARKNPDAQMKKPMTLDDYLALALGGGAAAPLRLLPEHRRRRRLHRHVA